MGNQKVKEPVVQGSKDKELEHVIVQAEHGWGWGEQGRRPGSGPA